MELTKITSERNLQEYGIDYSNDNFIAQTPGWNIRTFLCVFSPLTPILSYVEDFFLACNKYASTCNLFIICYYYITLHMEIKKTSYKNNTIIKEQRIFM